MQTTTQPILSPEQRQLVEAHLNLVDRVIRREIHVSGRTLQCYEDFYQVGCEALCRAAFKYRPERGRFASLAYTSIRNAMLRHIKRLKDHNNYDAPWPQEGDEDYLPFLQIADDGPAPEEQVHTEEILAALKACRNRCKGTSQKGLEAILLRCAGENVQDLADQYQVQDQRVRFWIRRGQEALRKDPAAMAQMGFAA